MQNPTLKSTFMKKPNHLFIVGFMASGKSTFGKRVAIELGYQFIDTDKEIERQEGKTIPQIFEEEGEQYFRRLEMKFLKSVSDFKVNTVFSTGGGMACNQYRINRMLNLGKLIYLEIDVKSVINRLKNAKQKRPLLSNLSEDDLSKKINSMLNKRKKYYEQASQSISALNAKKINGLSLDR
jgi:shikimate kinase